MKYIGQHIFDYVASFRQNVGIGTDTPNAALHVYGTTGIISESPGNATITIRRNDNVQYGATLKYHSGNTEKWVAGLSDAGDFTNSTGNEYFIGTAKTSPVFLINSSGQVGIGLTNPQNPLSVQSASNTVARFTSTDNRGNILIEDDDTSGYVVAEGGTLGFGFSASQSANNINVDSSNNNVGIGTVSPDNILHITKDQGGAASALKLENKAGANNTGFDIDFQLASSGLSAKIGAVRTNSPGAGDSDIFFSTSTNGTSVTEAMRITHDGNVLIGTATDNNSRLRILGATSDATKSALEIRDSSASALFTVRNDGRIDTSGNLNVGGDLTVTGTTTTIDTTNLNVEDKNITINYSTGDSSSTADGAGITIQDAVDSSTDATLLWNTSNSTFNFSHGIRVPDNVKIQAGNGGDFDIFHTGSATTIDNATGHLTIQNSADDSDIVFKSDDGSGGLATYITIDGSTNRVNFNKPIKIADNTAVNIGSGLDLRLSHDGTDSTIRNYAGDLKIIASDDDKDIIFQSDDGSGGVETYFFLDGSESVVTFPDDKRLTFGTGRDLFLYHTGTDMVMKNFTGDMTIRNEANDKDIIFQSDDGSGGVTTYMTIDGGAAITTVSREMRFFDNVKLKLGSGPDCEFLHDGTDTKIHNDTGHLKIEIDADDKDFSIFADDQSGGLAEYFRVDGSLGINRFIRDSRHNDNITASFGDGDDLQIRHDGTDSIIDNLTGTFYIRNQADDKDIVFICDNSTGSTETYFRLDGSANTAGNPVTLFPDNSLLGFGEGFGDLQLHHDGSNSYIKNRSTGDLHIRQDVDDKDIILEADDGSGGVTPYITLDGSQTRTIAGQHLQMADGKALYVGASTDAGFYHLSGHNYIENNTGDLNIVQNTDDGDIIFKGDDGSGGTTTYLRIDGGAEIMKAGKNLRFNDNVKSTFGTSDDMKLYHNGTSSVIENHTGDLFIINNTDDGDIKFQSDDGSGGVQTYLTIDGGLESVIVPDTIYLAAGSSLDLSLRHDGTNSHFQNNTGDLTIKNAADDKNIIFQSDDGSGGLTTYFQLYGNHSGNPVTQFPDNSQIHFGDGFDFRITHDGSQSILNNQTGNLEIVQNADDADIIFKCDDGSGGTTEYFRVDGGDSMTRFTRQARFSDSVKLKFGSGGDTAIYHDSGNSYIDHTGTGHLYIRQGSDDNDIIFQSDDGSGGLTEYFKLVGSTNSIIQSVDNYVLDNKRVFFGNGGDLRIYHDGTNSYIQNDTGQLYILNKADDKDIEFQSDDGSGGLATYFMLDGSATTAIFKVDAFLNDSSNYIYSDISDNSLKFADNTTLKIGTGNDLQLLHDGSNSHVVNYEGDLKITNNANDKDVIFNCDDGTGGNTAYITLDGSVTTTKFSKNTLYEDNVRAQFGTGSDANIRHDGTDTYIGNSTGHFYIQQAADDKDLVFQCDDGSGGLTTYFKLDGSVVMTRFSQTLNMFDNVKISIGTSQDLQIYHDGTNNYIQGVNGDLYIENKADDKDVRFQCDDGSGGTQIYFMLDGSEARISTKVNNRFDDSVRLELGTSGDLDLYHDGSHSYINNVTGDLIIRNQADDEDILFQCDNGSGGDTTYLTLDGSSTITIAHKDIYALDNIKLRAGSDGDLQMFHDGTDSQIKNATGDLKIEVSTDDKDIIFRGDDGSGAITTYFRIDGSAAEHNGSATTALYTNWADNSRISIGSSHDLQLDHNGTDSVIRNETGDLYIMNKADDKDIIFQSDDSSGGTETYFKLDGSTGFTQFADSKQLTFGAGDDLKIQHNGTNSEIGNFTGSFNIYTHTDNGDINFQADDGSGGITTYFMLDGSAETNIFSKPVQVGVDDTGHDVIFYGATSGKYMQWDESNDYLNFRDSTKIMLGNSNDLQLSHNGTDSYIENVVGHLYIKNTADDKDIIFQSDDGSGGVQTYFKLDGSVNSTMFPDSSKLYFGSGHDAYIEHDGTNTYLSNSTGKLIIRNTLDDSDIELVCDDGSGGNTAYLTLDGSATRVLLSQHMQFIDNKNLKLGDGADFQLYHTGTGSVIQNATGNLTIQQDHNDGDIIFRNDDGSGGTAEYFRVDGDVGYMIASKAIRALDSVNLQLGASADFTMQHNGTNTILQNFTGNLEITQGADDGDIIFKSDDGSGGTAEYFRVDGGDHSVKFIKEIKIASDSHKLTLGASRDLSLYHDGTDSYVENLVGDLYIKNTADDKDIIFQSDNGSGGVIEYLRLDGSHERLTVNSPNGIVFFDSIKANFGTDSDLQIYHDGSNSYIEDAGTGDLILRTNATAVRMQYAGEMMLKGIANGAVELYHNNVKKLETSSDGVDITGDLNVSVASTSSGIYAQFINLKGFCTLAANYKFAEDLEDTKSPFEMALDYGSATISSSTEVNQSQLFRAAGFHVPVACSVNAINMQLTCNNAGNVTIAVVEYRPSEAGTDQVDHPRTVYEEVVVASNDNNNKVKTVTVATADLDNTAIPAGSHIMIMAKGDDVSTGGSAFISAAIEIKW